MTREIVLLEIFNSENLISFYELVITRTHFYAFIEYCNGGSLFDLIQLKGRLSELVARKILAQIIAGLSAMYEKEIIHRDLKLENILIHFPSLGSTLE